MRLTALLRCAALVVVSALGTAAEPLRGQSIPVRMPGPASSLVGADFDVPLEVDLSARTEKLGSFALRVSWNPAVLQFVHGINGAFGDVFANEDSLPAGVVRLTGANPMGVPGKFLLGTMRLRPLVEASDTLRLQVLELYAARTFTNLLASAVPSNRAYCPALGRYGDLNASGTITASDAQLVLMVAVGLSVPGGTVPQVGDVDGDGVIGTRDALIILSRTVELDVSAFPLLRVMPGACGEDNLKQLAVQPGNVTALVGQEVYYSSVAIDSTELPASHAGLRWVSSAPAVATIDSSGTAVAVSPGQSVITVTEPGGRQASVTLTVVSARRAHWVDALGYNNTNRLGTPGLPFSTIGEAMDWAQAGDSVLVRKGRYQETVIIDRSLTLLGIGDSAPVRPLIAGVGSYPTGVKVTGGQRVEIRGFRFDTLYYGVEIDRGDTVVLSDNDFRARYSSYASVYVDSVGALYIRRSRFDGTGSTAYYNDAIYVADWAGLVSLDSTLITDYGGDALVGYGVDSLVVMNSVFRHNYFGISVDNGYYLDTARTLGAVFRRNLFLQNDYGHIYLQRYRTARFNHNAVAGAGYDGIELYGDSLSRISFLGDSISSRSGYWLYAYNFDSLTIDSTLVLADYGVGYYGENVVLRNSRFLDIGSYALDLNNTSSDSGQVLVRNVEFRGHPGCSRCADGLYGYYTRFDIDSIAAWNMDYVFYGDYVDLSARRVVVDGSDYAFEFDCGIMRLDQVLTRDVSYPVRAYGCSATDSLVVDSSSFQRGYEAVYTSSVHTVLTRDSITDFDYGIEVNGYGLRAAANAFVRFRWLGVDYYGNGVDSALVDGNLFQCRPEPSYLYYAAIDAQNALLRIRNNTLTNCGSGIYAGTSAGTPGTPVEIRGNVLTAYPGNTYEGIEVFGATAAAHVVQNTVTGFGGAGGYGSIYVSSTTDSALVDSNTVNLSAAYGIKAYGQRSLVIRNNTINNVDGRPVYRGAGIYFEGGSATSERARITGNRINRSKTSGIVLYGYNYDTVTVRVDSNVVKGADSVGIWVGYYSVADVSWNAIDSTGSDGVRLTELYRGTGQVTVDSNNLSRSKRYGIHNLTAEPIPATWNYWGGPNGPRGFYGDSTAGATTADSVSNFVTWNPYATTPWTTPVPVAPIFAAAPPGFTAAAPVVSPTTAVSPPGTARPRPADDAPVARHERPAAPQRPAGPARVRPPGRDDRANARIIQRDRARAAADGRTR